MDRNWTPSSKGKYIHEQGIVNEIDIPDADTSQGVQIRQEFELGSVTISLVQLGGDIIEASDKINALGQVTPRGILKIVDSALPFE